MSKLGGGAVIWTKSKRPAVFPSETEEWSTNPFQVYYLASSDSKGGNFYTKSGGLAKRNLGAARYFFLTKFPFFNTEKV